MKCNARCSYCYELEHLLKPSADEQTLSPNQARSFVKEYAAAGGFRLYLTGGEPMLSPLVAPIVRAGKEYGVKCVVNTNGLRVDEGIYQAIKDSGAIVSVSLDSHIASEHNAARNQKSAASIDALLDRCKSDGIDTRVISVLQKTTVSEYDVGPVLSGLEASIKQHLAASGSSMRLRVLPAIFPSVAYIMPNGDVSTDLWTPQQKVYGNIASQQMSDWWNAVPYNTVDSYKGLLHWQTALY
jgi:hypothetical protein